MLEGDSRYLDVLERTLYNGLISGVSLSGDLFFYPNPLEWDGTTPFNQGAAGRQPWFEVACCPGNIARFLPSLPGYIYAVKDDAIYVNLFIQSEASISLDGKRDPGGTKVNLTQITSFPWEGKIKIIINPERAAEFAVKIRIPGWALGRPVPSDL